MDKIEAILTRFPRHTYDPDNKSSALYKLIRSIVDEFNITMGNIDRISRITNINEILPDDIYNRFGALLNIRQNKGETNEQYRSRLKVSITSLSGGTAEAIKYAIASGLGINNDANAMDRIRIYDAWNYDGIGATVKNYGHVICSIDLNQGNYSADMEKVVAEAANNVKAAGVTIEFIYSNFRVIYYNKLDDIVYRNLDTITYDKVGE